MSQYKPMLSPETRFSHLSSLDYLSYLNDLVIEITSSPDYHDPQTGYISTSAWKHLVTNGLLSSALGERPEQYRQEEILQTLRTLSFHDLHLGLTYGITTGLVIMSLQRFSASQGQRDKYLNKIRNGEMFGLAVTEQNKSGSSALDMDSSYTINPNGTTNLSFSKHLQGLSGKSGLIVAAKKTNTPTTTIGLFIIDQQKIQTQLTIMSGLKGIPYGLNSGQLVVNTNEHLMSELPRRELQTFQDIFTKSRLLFVGMTLGNQERTEAEANLYASTRLIGGVLQKDIAVPRYKLDLIHARRIVTEAIYNQVASCNLINGDTSHMVSEANMAKVLTTQYALESAHDRAELMGGRAFYDRSALQDYVDIWPFSIFEGTRWMLNTQIGHNFRLPESLDHLDKATHDLLRFIASSKTNKVREEILGQIESRCFALDCLNPQTLASQDFEMAKTLLNLEIQQQGLEYFSVKI